MKKQSGYARAIFIILLFISILAVVILMRYTASVILPICIAVLLSFVLEPLIRFLNNKCHIPWAPCVVIVLIGVFLILLSVGSLLFSSLKTILELYPKYEERFTTVYSTVAGIFKLPFDADTSLIDNLWNQLGVRTAVQNFAVSLSSFLISFSKNLFMVILFMLFFLLELRFIKQKVEYALEDQLQGRVASIAKSIIHQITKYMSVKFFISFLTGLLMYIVTLTAKMDFPIVWGFMAFVLNFIPSFGSIISGFLTALFALVQFWPTPGPFLYVTIIDIVINMVLGNVIEPRVQGRNLGLSPFVLITSLTIWGWIWGFAGLILGVPMMVIVKIICENVELLHPLSILMGTFPIGVKTSKKQDSSSSSVETDCKTNTVNADNSSNTVVTTDKTSEKIADDTDK